MKIQVLHQPRRAHPHDDHFHIRIGCGAEQRALGCQDRGPIWPWWTDEAIKNETNDPLDDAALVHALLDPEEPVVAAAESAGDS